VVTVVVVVLIVVVGAIVVVAVVVVVVVIVVAVPIVVVVVFVLVFVVVAVVVVDVEFYSCEENWPDPTSRRLFTVISLLFQYIVPCVVIIYCYAHVSVALRRRARNVIGSGACSAARPENGHADLRNRMKLRRKRRTNRMLIAMVAIFAVCWLPLNVILLSLEHDESIGASPYFLLVFFAAHVVAMSSTVYNPFLSAFGRISYRCRDIDA